MQTAVEQAAAHPALTEAAHSNSHGSISQPSSHGSAAVIHPTVVHRQSHTAHSSAPSTDSTIHPTVVHRQSANIAHNPSASLSAFAASPPSPTHRTSASAAHSSTPSQTPPLAVDSSPPAAHDTASRRPSHMSLPAATNEPAHSHSQHLWQTAVAAVSETTHHTGGSSGPATARRVKRVGTSKRAAADDDVELTCVDFVSECFFCCPIAAANTKPDAKVAAIPAPAQSKMK